MLEAAILSGFRDESTNQHARGTKIGKPNEIFTSEQVTENRARVKAAKESKEADTKAVAALKQKKREDEQLQWKKKQADSLSNIKELKKEIADLKAQQIESRAELKVLEDQKKREKGWEKKTENKHNPKKK